MRYASRLTVTCLLIVLASKIGLAEASVPLTPPPPIIGSLQNQGNNQPGLEIGYTADPFTRVDTRVIIPQLALALYHLCSLVKHNPCGHYILRGPWHNGISFSPLSVLFGLPKQQPEFWQSLDMSKLLTPSWLKGPKKYPDPLWRMAQLFPFTNQGNATMLNISASADLWQSFTPMPGLILFPKPIHPEDEITTPGSHGTLKVLEWKF